MKREPLVTTALITSAIAALLSLLTAFGVPLTEVQQDAINQMVLIVAPLVVAFVARYFVTPVADPRDHEGVSLVRADAKN